VSPDLPRRRGLWLALGWLGVLLVSILSLAPNPPGASLQGADKLGHLFAYGALMFWFVQAGAETRASALGLLLLGALLEVLQGLSGYRESSFGDLIADGLGIGLGWLLARRFPHCLASIEARLP
jgi:VanZ family protein